MIKKIESSADFETIKRAHEEFLIVALTQTFLQIKTISRCIEQVLQLCHSFVNVVTNDEQNNFVNITGTKIIDMDKEFTKLNQFFITLLEGLRTHKQSTSLELLISMLDFNKETKKQDKLNLSNISCASFKSF